MTSCLVEAKIEVEEEYIVKEEEPDDYDVKPGTSSAHSDESSSSHGGTALFSAIAGDEIKLEPKRSIPLTLDGSYYAPGAYKPYRLRIGACPICCVVFPSSRSNGVNYDRMNEISATTFYQHILSFHKEVEGTFFRCSICPDIKTRNYRTVDSHLTKIGCGGGIEFEHDPDFKARIAGKQRVIGTTFPVQEPTTDFKKIEIYGADICPFCNKQLRPPPEHTLRALTAFTVYNHIHMEHPELKGDMFRCSACPKFRSRAHTAAERHYNIPDTAGGCGGSLYFDPRHLCESLLGYVHNNVVTTLQADKRKISGLNQENHALKAPVIKAKKPKTDDELDCPLFTLDCIKDHHKREADVNTIAAHLMLVHPDWSPYRCTECRVMGKSVAEMEAHARFGCTGKRKLNVDLADFEHDEQVRLKRRMPKRFMDYGK